MPAYTQDYIGTYNNQDILITHDTTTQLSCNNNYGLSLWMGLFTSISAMNNAGFDIFPGNYSLAPFRND